MDRVSCPGRTAKLGQAPQMKTPLLGALTIRILLGWRGVPSFVVVEPVYTVFSSTNGEEPLDELAVQVSPRSRKVRWACGFSPASAHPAQRRRYAPSRGELPSSPGSCS
jgi:hypothetical protein